MKCKTSDLSTLGRLVIAVLSPLGLLSVTVTKEKDDSYTEFNNMTIINLAIKFCGPLYERNLTVILLTLQACVSLSLSLSLLITATIPVLHNSSTAVTIRRCSPVFLRCSSESMEPNSSTMSDVIKRT